jgi:hypothetical protein
MVKFSNVKDFEEEIELQGAAQEVAESTNSGTVPRIRLSVSSDVADHYLASPDRAKQTDAAAEKAHNEAKRLELTKGDTVDDENGVFPEHRSDEDENVRQARRLLRAFTNHSQTHLRLHPRSGTQTPAVDKQLHDLPYVEEPDQYRPNPLLLFKKLQDVQQQRRLHREDKDDVDSQTTLHDDSGARTPGTWSPRRLRSGRQSRRNSGEYSTPPSGVLTPLSKRPKWYERDDPEFQSLDASSTSALLATSAMAAAPATPTIHQAPQPVKYAKIKSSHDMISRAVEKIKNTPRVMMSRSSSFSSRVDEEQLIRDAAAIIACRRYLKKLARALMLVGAPTHRLEEYMKTSARALHIDADFMYVPGSMLVTFNDQDTLSTQVTLVRE